jgi:hypothetical protein
VATFPIVSAFHIVGSISEIELIASGRAIRELGRLRKHYGGTRWRKLKGIAVAHFPNGTSSRVEVHWYEAHGVGKREMKIKRILSEH